METVMNCVREHRTNKGITQEELAEAVGVSRQTIIAIEKGSYVPSVLLALKLATYFTLPVEKLFKI
ncbi:helix-turn-helix transcriptional regulator [Candidatus Parcubacteria bacterium]|uniref:Transcriptional regulator n=1 Tax=Candidatus Kaiserbacteria bacterium CG10_big_fil_rev_8_21_14_0_10_47_16 TaxID=1974608 RepID=A0A2H0UE20_9BACT|nr:helix-turn-helix transcriptional regulator [Candidatus Parcubacteria bacterium]PIR84659.1 MAG: transcriptional regulator [Candidatus Kaiserbacteria bacterium CG10_big_fil_rev_8_21_14_0_10_47_16]